MNATVKCKSCKSGMTVVLKKGATPTASLYAHMAKTAGLKETADGYICKKCLKKQEENK